MPDTVNLRDETTGQVSAVPQEKAAAYIAQGFRPETDEEATERTTAETFHAEHGGIAGGVGSALAGGLSGLTLGLSDQAIAGLGGGRVLRHMEAEHPYATGAATVGGALLPAIFSGGATAGESAAGLGARILARTPAGLAQRVGRAVGGLGEGAGIVGRMAAGTAGAAAEGSLYGGGQYLTETALEDKPLSAAGFVAGMGHGALFAAPIGGATHLAAGTLQRARSLFPRSEVSAAAAAGVKEEASSALAQTVRDGDAMAAAAERKLSDVDAQTQMAQAGETVTRRVFGEAHPQAMADQVTGAVDRQAVTEALDGYQQARQQFDDWLTHEADPDLAKALVGLTPGELQTPALAAPRVPVGEFGAPGARGIKTPEELQRALESSAPEAAADLEQVTGAGGPRALRGGAKGTPAGGVPAHEIVQRGMAEQPATAVGKRPRAVDAPQVTAGGRIEIGEIGRTQQYEARMPDGTTRKVGSEQDVQKLLEAQMPEGFRPAKVQTHRPLAIEHGLPATAADVAAIDENAIYIAKPSEIAKRDVWGDPLKDANRERILQGWRDGEKLPPIDAFVTPEGRIYIEDGNHRLAAAAQTDRPVAIRFRDGTGYRPHGEAAEIGARLRGGAPGAGGELPGIPTYEHLKAQPDAIITTVPSSVIEERGWYEMPGQGADVVKADKARAAIREGQREPIDITVGKDGKLFVSEGRNRLNAAIEQGAPIKVRWDYGTAGGPGDVFKGGRAAASAEGDLMAALSGTKSALDKGENLVEMGAPARDAYRAAKAERTTAAAEHFRAKALEGRAAKAEAVAAGETRNPFHEPVTAAGIKSPGELDEFFKNLTAPKTRDAYVAANIGRAMREEGSHAAALAKVEREWAERVATEEWAERAAVLEYEGGYIRAEAERIAREEVDHAAHGPGAESPPAWEPKKNSKRTEAAKKAAAASVERLHEIHSAVASNLPQELQSAWASDGYKFLREEAARIRGIKDRINAASKMSEAFTEKYGAASETGRSYEGDRFFRRAEIEAKHAESWADEQERKHYAAMSAEHGGGDLSGVKRVEVSGPIAIEPEVGDATMGRILAKHGLGEPAPIAAKAPDSLAARILANEVRPTSIVPTAAVSDAAVRGEGQLAAPMSKAEIAAQRDRFRAIAPEQRAAKAIMRHNGKDVDMGPGLARAAKAIGDMEEANAKLTNVLGSEAPASAVEKATAFRKATGKAQEQAAASAAKAAADIKGKVPATETAGLGSVAGPGSGIGRAVADTGTALEVMKALGVHVPALSHIPVIGPVLGLFFKARAVMSILGRKGGSIGKSTESVIAGKAAATRDRIAKATGTLLEGGARAAGKASHLAGPAVLLADALFPGGDKPKSDKPRDLFAARVDDIVRAQQPGAVDQAIAQRYPTSDPELHDAVVAQVQRGIAFLDSKRPKETVLPGILPGDGRWKPSMAAIEEFGKYVHAVNDPVSVLEDLAKGHPSAEGAETLRVVYPELYQYGQSELLKAAPEMERTLPYARRVMISILYQIPVDGTMHPSHAAYIQTPAPAPAAPHAPTSTGPLRLGQQTLSPLDQRAGA